MSGLRTNWESAGLEKKEFTPLPNGTYHATVTGCMFNQSEKKVNFEFTITDSDYQNRKVWDNLDVVKVGWKIKKNFQALGVWTDPDTDDELVKNCEAALNKGAEVDVTSREYQGKTYNNVKTVKPLMATQAAAIGVATAAAINSDDIPF